jgi:hypothetical protein
VQCYEKKVISGDNKTEKNSYYGILRYDKDNSYITTQISFHSSKLDETPKERRLDFLLPQHEYFHQYFVLADCESQLFREKSRGLPGGSFLLATILNRKDAKSKKGKEAVEAFKEFLLLKADATFNNFFMHKFELNHQVDNTPDLLRTSTAENKRNYLHGLVATALRDLIPHFKNAKIADCLLEDFPLKAGRVDEEQTQHDQDATVDVLEAPQEINLTMAEATVRQLQATVDKHELIQKHLVKVSSSLSSSRNRKEFCCSLCSFKSKYEAICLTHIENCLDKLSLSNEGEDGLESNLQTSQNNTTNDTLDEEAMQDHDELNSEQDTAQIADEKPDMFWNYKCSEFLVDSLFAIATVYEKFGDGLGMFIQSKMLLPILHGLKHSNYTMSIHRFITCVLCEATPKEALKLIHERFSNKEGKVGANIFKDRRMEHRIGTLKMLIGNLGPNFDEEHVQLVNKTVEIKEELFYMSRKAHGVNIRTGNHNPRDDTPDYKTMIDFLEENEAHVKKTDGRTFGDYDLPEDLFLYFDRAQFYRWIAGKNEEATKTLENKNC